MAQEFPYMNEKEIKMMFPMFRVQYQHAKSMYEYGEKTKNTAIMQNAVKLAKIAIKLDKKLNELQRQSLIPFKLEKTAKPARIRQPIEQKQRVTKREAKKRFVRGNVL